MLFFLLFSTKIFGEGDDFRKISGLSIIQNMTGWIYGYRQHYLRFPVSLDDLAENKPPQYDYNIGNAIKRYQNANYTIIYNLIDENNVEIKVQLGSDLYIYYSSDDTFYFYQNNMLTRKFRIRE
jgi:hypothetical protein